MDQSRSGAPRVKLESWFKTKRECCATNDRILANPTAAAVTQGGAAALNQLLFLCTFARREVDVNVIAVRVPDIVLRDDTTRHIASLVLLSSCIELGLKLLHAIRRKRKML